MCPEHARFGILPSPLSPDPESPSQPSVEAPAERCTSDPYGRPASAHVPKPSTAQYTCAHSARLVCTCAHSARPVHMCPNPASNHGTIWRTTCSYATSAKVTRGVVSAPGGHSCSKTPPYQQISSRGKDKQKELACPESIRSI